MVMNQNIKKIIIAISLKINKTRCCRFTIRDFSVHYLGEFFRVACVKQKTSRNVNSFCDFLQSTRNYGLYRNENR